MEKNRIRLFGKKAFGVRVSDYGLENGYLDYFALSMIIGASILNNTLIGVDVGYWEPVAGEENDDEIYQFYIISEFGYEFLQRHTDEIVLYNEELDIYLWCITHFGTSWDYVLTDVKLIGGDY